MAQIDLSDPAEQRIERLPLHEAILIRLRDMIIEGHLPPGARLNEGQIGLQLGVSRTPLREAIKYLASEGLVELVPSRGAVVKSFGAKEVHDMLEVIRMLEQQAGALACRLADDRGIARIRALHDEMLAHYARRDRLAYYKVNQAIHTGIVALADNVALSEVHARLQTRLKRVRFIGHEGAEKWASAVAEHEEMIAALESRDPDRLAEILGRHLSLAWERVRDDIPGAPEAD
ncbi:GntR family transcriptional regulator (plasmid) [Paracoccus liaowanqingii]|uniref:GntR family transcriptional regulator n=1 Tax=Paracoccus liaowanqingii TaxID=2560053 RepID=A0A4Y5SVZ0_9RHOB|nr:GntR family transcriptional regulator [Paracoccus liaowanqingii]QDA36985.1 GntR family transcriptional regulator [Paracoccus liaowanqingii]